MPEASCGSRWCHEVSGRNHYYIYGYYDDSTHDNSSPAAVVAKNYHTILF